jgi:Tfp pilus assembly protein PilV
MSLLEKRKKGMALVEILIGSAIISVGILATISSFNAYTNYALANQKNIQAGYLLEEGIEAATFLRDGGWTANISRLSTSTPYYLTWNGTSWATTTTAQYVDGEFLRSISVSDVKRNNLDVINASGTYDPNTKMITATVSYFQGHATTTKSISTYLTNLYGN